MERKPKVKEDIHKMLVLGSSVRDISEQLRIEPSLITDIQNGWLRPDLTGRMTNRIQPAVSPPWLAADVAEKKRKIDPIG